MKSKTHLGTTFTTAIFTLGFALLAAQSARAITVNLAIGSNTGPDAGGSWILPIGANTFSSPNADGTALIDGEISGSGNLLLQTVNSSNAQRRARINVAATYSGTTVLRSGDARFGVILGVDNALPVTTSLQFTTTNGGTGRPVWLDLNGHTQEFASFVTSTVTYNAIVNPANVETGTLIVNNSSDTTYNAFLGGTNALANLRNSLNGQGNNFGLTKKGAGKLTLIQNNTYSADTTISEGTLSIQKAYLADAADVILAGGAILDLDFVDTDTIDELIFDGLPQVVGTWGSIGSGAENESSRITGSGLLSVTTASSNNPTPFVITEIIYAPNEDTVTLTWTSQPGVSYSVKYSTDLSDWSGSIGSGITSGSDTMPDDGDRITVPFVLSGGVENVDDLFFRIEEE